MTTKHLADELSKLLHAQGLSQRALADKIGLSNSTISSLIGGNRPEASTLSAIIFHATDQPDLRQGLVIAHLKDEIIRANHNPADFHLGVASEVSDLQKVNSVLSLHKGLAEVILAAEKVPSLMATLTDLAELVGHFNASPAASLAKKATAKVAEKRKPSLPSQDAREKGAV